MATDDLGMLERRLEKLETQNRRLVRLAVVLFFAMTWPLLVAAEKLKPVKTIEAQKIVVSDANGVVRAELGTEPDGSAVLAFTDGKGGTSMSLRGVTAGPIIELADGMGGSIWLSSSATGASLSLSKGKGEIELATRATGDPTIKLQDKNGKIVWNAP
jgi:hypothetical protein